MVRCELGVLLLPLVAACSSAGDPALPLTAAPRGSVVSGAGGSMATDNSQFVLTPAPSGTSLMLTPASSETLPSAPPPPDLGAPCDPTRTVDSTGASLVVRDPNALQRFPLQRVLAQILATSGDQAPVTPLELLHRLFDTENTAAAGVFADGVHCDDPNDPGFAGSGQKPVYCPRAEGKLAKSAGLLDENSADFFAPVALVSRLDLMPSTFSTCGEYRIVYAKQSGRTDRYDR